VGLRIAALDSLLTGEGAVVVASAVALSEKVPDPALRPHGFAIEREELIDLDETAQQLVACGYERVDQVEERGQFAIRGDIIDLYPSTEERAVRCELFDVEVERLTYFSTFTQRSLEETDRVEIAPAAELAPEHRELAEIAALEYLGEGAAPRASSEGAEPSQRPDVAELLPYEDDTAGGLMTTEFVTLPRELTVGEALARLREMAETPNMIYYLYVVEGEGSWKLLGVIALRSLILADPSVPLADVMRTEFQKAHPDEPANEVAQRIAEYNLLALPVMDEAGDILGIITVDDAMEILLPRDWRQRLPRLFG